MLQGRRLETPNKGRIQCLFQTGSRSITVDQVYRLSLKCGRYIDCQPLYVVEDRRRKMVAEAVSPFAATENDAQALSWRLGRAATSQSRGRLSGEDGGGGEDGGVEADRQLCHDISGDVDNTTTTTVEKVL